MKYTMQVRKIDSVKKDRWSEIIEAAEFKIRKHQQRIRALRASIRGFKELMDAEEPWPGEEEKS